ncbi:MAG: hypothetical protein U1E45_19680 [Geminicoccaceae bacterium]
MSSISDRFRLATLTLALLAIQPAAAQAQYKTRLDQLLPEIDVFTLPPLVQQLKQDVTGEFAKRSDALADSIDDYLEPDDPRPLQEGWLAFQQKQAEERTKAFEGIYDRAEDFLEKAGVPDSPPHPALQWIARVRQEQFEVAVAVKSMPLASLRDLLTAKRDLYEQSFKNMEGEQSALESADNDIDRAGKTAREAMLTACTDLRRVKTEAERDISRIATGVIAALTAEDADDVADDLENQSERLAGDMKLFAARVGTGLSQVADVQDREKATIQMVLAKRDAVRTVTTAFDERWAETAVNDEFDEAEDAVDAIRTDGDRKDLLAFLDAARDPIEEHQEDFEEARERFVDRFKGIFVPPFDNASSERFAEFEDWLHWADDVRACAPSDILANITASSAATWGAKPSLVADPAAREVIERAYQDSGVTLASAIHDADEPAKALTEFATLKDRRQMRDDLSRGS